MSSFIHSVLCVCGGRGYDLSHIHSSHFAGEIGMLGSGGAARFSWQPFTPCPEALAPQRMSMEDFDRPVQILVDCVLFLKRGRAGLRKIHLK